MKMFASKKITKSIRWLGAFGASDYLSEALEFEFSCEDSVCAEDFTSFSALSLRCGVGLLCNRKNIIRRFDSDVWSFRNRDGKLTATKPENSSDHSELWVSGENKFTAIVVTGMDVLQKYPYLARVAIEKNIKLLLLKNGCLFDIDPASIKQPQRRPRRVRS